MYLHASRWQHRRATPCCSCGICSPVSGKQDPLLCWFLSVTNVGPMGLWAWPLVFKQLRKPGICLFTDPWALCARQPMKRCEPLQFTIALTFLHFLGSTWTVWVASRSRVWHRSISMRLPGAKGLVQSSANGFDYCFSCMHACDMLSFVVTPFTMMRKQLSLSNGWWAFAWGLLWNIRMMNMPSFLSIFFQNYQDLCLPLWEG